MARSFYLLGVVLLCAVVQADVIRYGPADTAFIEDLRERASSKIVRGWPAVEGQIPHQIALRSVNAVGGVSSCGGSLIHHEWVITAAHCVANRINFVILVGVVHIEQPDRIAETSRKYLHPDFNEAASSSAQTDDIALLGLEEPIPYGPTIQPCRLQNSESKNTFYQDLKLTVSGFGRTNDVYNGGVIPDNLLWTNLRSVTDEECRSWYSNSALIGREQTLCAGHYDIAYQSPCHGDSGGPLTLEDADGKPTMVGIVSFGSVWGCNSPAPSAFVRPEHYHGWLSDVTGIDFDWKPENLETS